MTSSVTFSRHLPAIMVLTLSCMSLSALAQAKTDTAPPAKSGTSEPSAYEKTKAAAKKAAKATAKAGGDAADATKKVAGKAGAAVTSAGEKINAKVPRTEAYKKQQPNDNAKPQSEQTKN